MIECLADIRERKLIAITSILNSGRLLSDHSEVLEECFIDVNESSSIAKYFTGTNCSLLMASTLLTTFLNKRLGITLGFISSGYTVACFSKFIFNRQLWSFQNSIESLLDDIDRFDTCTRRNIAYFRENAVLQSSQLSAADNNVRVDLELNSCAKSLIEIIESIRNAIQSLETVSAPKKIENIFQPLENLNESQYFRKSYTESSLSNLKYLYNIFLYVQSHLLTRMSLFLIYGNKDPFIVTKQECSSLSRILCSIISNDNLRYEQLTLQPKFENSHPHTIDHIATEPMLNLKSHSISVSSKMLAIANQLRQIDAMVQRLDKLTEDELILLMPSIAQLEDSICVCQTDYQRFAVAYHNFMHVKHNVRYPDGQAINIEQAFTADESALNFEDLNEIEAVDEEEFFTSTERTDDDEVEHSNRYRKCLDEELTSRNLNVIKQRFKPVLAQLKCKIEPIALSLRERERNHLLSKGIDPSEFVDCKPIVNVESGSGSDDSEAEDVRPRKINRTYDEMRKFLEGKPQISLIPMRSANESFLNEDILE